MMIVVMICRQHCCHDSDAVVAAVEEVEQCEPKEEEAGVEAGEELDITSASLVAEGSLPVAVTMEKPPTTSWWLPRSPHPYEDGG